MKVIKYLLFIVYISTTSAIGSHEQSNISKAIVIKKTVGLQINHRALSTPALSGAGTSKLAPRRLPQPEPASALVEVDYSCIIFSQSLFEAASRAWHNVASVHCIGHPKPPLVKSRLYQPRMAAAATEECVTIPARNEFVV